MSNLVRFVTCAATVAALALTGSSARASGAVVPPANTLDPTTLDVDVAVAVTPFGTTRWTRLTVGGAPSVMWLVPARPGAAVDWSSDGWLTALADASSPRVAPPSESPPCGMPSTPERVAAWGTSGTQKFPRAVVVHESAGEARAHVTARGFALSNAVSAKITDAYARGYALVSVELETGGGGVFSSPTLRISDDGGAIVPLALTGTTQAPVRVTAMVLGEGPAELPGARELDPTALLWGRNYSGYASARASALVAGGGAVWLREAASHDVLFGGVPLPNSSPIQPLFTGYFREANGQAQPTCDAATRDAAAAAGTVGRACPAGTLARVPGGTACVPTTGPINPAAFTCGSGVDDLALALSGSSPSKAFLSRFTGLVAANNFGADLAITTGTSLSPLAFAGQFEPCPVPGTPPTGSFTPAPTSPTAEVDERPYRYDRSGGGCTGSSTTIIYEDTGEEAPVADEGCGGGSTSSTETTTPTTSTGDDGDNCGGDSSTSSSSSSSSGSDDSDSDDDSSDDSGWDDDDDDDSSSPSSDSCECGKSSTGTSSSSSSGWDESEATPKSLRIGPPEAGEAKPSAGKVKGKKHHKKHHKKTSRNMKRRGPSPVSRYALLFVALLLPLRRRLRVQKF